MIKTIAFGLFIAACSNNQNYDDVYTGPVHGKISGVVTTTDGVPLQGVSVSAQDVSSTTSADGTYVLEDVDPNDFEKKKDIFSLYETEMEIYKQKAEDEEIKGYEDFEGIEEEWEDFNQSKKQKKQR